MLRMVAAGTSMSTPSETAEGCVSGSSAFSSEPRHRTAMIFELQVADLVDEESLEGGVEEGRRLEPLQVRRQLVAIDEEASEEEAAGTSKSVAKASVEEQQVELT